ncbi:MAG: hypothetical protein IKW05_05250 [Muribaculaceae bacterium]|nr:hypothetical protein [Muribaculaceae bacterium]
MFREGEPEIHERVLARDRYERRVKSGMFQSREAMQDSMLGLKEAMQAIVGKGTNVEDIEGFENAYLGENRLSSVNKAEADAFAHTMFKPMLDEVAKLAKNNAGREELTDYMMAKHGLERNRVMDDDTTRSVKGNRDSRNLRVFEEGLDTSYRSYSDDSEKTRRAGETERLVNIAKQHGMYIPTEVTKTLGN